MTANGYAGNEILRGGPGSDSLFGLDGHATTPANPRSTCLAVTLDDLANDGADADCKGRAEERDDVRITVENVDGSAMADRFTGSGVRNVLRGFGGVDVLRGGVGPDLLDGGPGDDQVSGGDGYDTLQPHSGKDPLDGGPGNDTFQAPRDPAGGPVEIRSRDGELDWLTCTAAAGDAASIDLGTLDRLPAEGSPNTCETVSRGPGASASCSGAVVTFVTGAGVANAVGVGTATDGSIQLTDTGATISPGSRRESVSANRVVCDPRVAWVSVSTGDLADRVAVLGSKRLIANGGAGADRLTGGWLDDELTGGPGRDTVEGLEGNDTLFRRDSFVDALIECDGIPSAPSTADKVQVDPGRGDPAPRSCETLLP